MFFPSLEDTFFYAAAIATFRLFLFRSGVTKTRDRDAVRGSPIVFVEIK